MNRFICFLLYSLALVIAVSGCARTKVDTKLLDRKYQVYEVSVQSFEECGGLWHGSESCIANLKPQVRGVASSLCGKSPESIHSCGERDSDKGRQVFCVVECSKRPNVDESVLKRAERCQKQGGIWINNRCELDIQ